MGPDWSNLVETRDPHQYGDFALTKYYDPAANIGLSTSSDEAISKLDSIVGAGTPIDPGKMGSYFQDQGDVTANLRTVQQTTALFAKLVCSSDFVLAYAGSLNTRRKRAGLTIAT